jgi:Ca2+-binding EF-hand superfamily protein
MRDATNLLLIGALLAILASCGSAKTAPVKDICKDCVDPYVPTAERARFFKVAGKDNEIDADEFQTDKTATGGFVRKFDTWAGMLAFDKNSNKTFDWFEADAYRNDIRRRVLKAYDSDKNKKLTGKERQAANQALAAGKIPGATRRTGGQGSAIWGGGQITDAMRLRMFDKNHDGVLDADEKAAADKWQADSEKRRAEYAKQAERWRKLNDELRKKHDADGKLDADERKGYYEEYRKRAAIVQWDKDGDGTLSDAERKDMETKQAERKKHAEEFRRKWTLQRWDKDKDGKLSQQELTAKKDQEDQWKERAEQSRKEQAELYKKHDTDGDGKHNADERKAYYKAMQDKWRIRRWDKDKDGTLSQQELKAKKDQEDQWKEQAEQSRKEQAELRKKHDTDGDGKLDADERKTYYKAIQDKWRIRRWDKNKDGRLDDAERKAMEDQQSKLPYGGNVIINSRSISPGQGGVRILNAGKATARSGMTVWRSEDGAAGGTIIIQNTQEDEEDK